MEVQDVSLAGTWGPSVVRCLDGCGPDRKYLVVQVDDCSFINKCLPFGIATAVGVHGGTVDAIFKWVDDTMIWQLPILSTTSTHVPTSSSYSFPNLSTVFNLANNVGVPLHPDKVQQFGSNITYVGFDWDITKKRVSLSEKK